MEVEVLPRLRGKKLTLWEELLRKSHLEPDAQREATVLIYENDRLIATGARQGNLLKCIAVDPAYQGEGLTATLLTHLQQDALAAGYRHLFLYTKPQNERLFASLFFYPVAKTEKVLLMENRPDGISSFLQSHTPTPVEGTVGAVVMNCNPFTLGHRYLVETAAKDCDLLYVFVLSEDKSEFSAKDRFAMVQAGTADLKNVRVLPTGPYLISSASFPTYFLKGQENVEGVQCELDVVLFAKYYAPHFSITRRYVGTEPNCKVTAAYNEAMKALLPTYGITLREIPRLSRDNIPVSATNVRNAIKTGDETALRSLVPQSTFTYLKDNNLL